MTDEQVSIKNYNALARKLVAALELLVKVSHEDPALQGHFCKGGDLIIDSESATDRLDFEKRRLGIP